MSPPLSGLLVGYLSRLRFPTLFKITVGLLLVNMLLPDPIPLLDEIATALVAVVLAAWKLPTPPPEPTPPARESVTLEGESRRE